MAMAIISSPTRLGRRLFLGAPFVLAAGAALAQSAEIKFKQSSLVVVTGAREIERLMNEEPAGQSSSARLRVAR